MDVRVSAEVEDRSGALETKHLGLGDVAALAVAVVAQEERVEPAVRREALAGGRHVRRGIDREDALYQLAHQRLAPGVELCRGDPREGAVAALKLDLRLDRGRVEARLLAPTAVQASEQPPGEQELVA